MASKERIAEKMEVVAMDGEHIGTVDHLEGEQSIKLAKTDPAAGGVHRWIPLSWVDTVDDKVCLSKSKQDVQAQWDTTLRQSQGA